MGVDFLPNRESVLDLSVEPREAFRPSVSLCWDPLFSTTLLMKIFANTRGFLVLNQSKSIPDFWSNLREFQT